MKLVKLLLVCLLTAGLFCSGCKKEESAPAEPNAQVTSSQDVAIT